MNFAPFNRKDGDVVPVNSARVFIGNTAVTLAWDYFSLAQTSTVDTYTFKTGGSSGTTVATVTITYTDSTKATIDHCAVT